MKREAREIECNTRTKYVGGINEDMTNMKKDMERYQDEAVRAGTTFASAKAELCRLSSNIDGARGKPEGDEADRKDDIDRRHGGEGKGPEGRGKFRLEDKRFWSTGVERKKLVTPEIDRSGRRGEEGRRYK